MSAFARHLPPSRDIPRVLALDETAASGLPEAAAVVGPGRLIFALHALPFMRGCFDAVVGRAGPGELPHLKRALRPGGRLILVDRADPQRLVEMLKAAGLVHCLVEPMDGLNLYRGESPPKGVPIEGLQSLVAAPQSPIPNLRSPFVFLLVAQTPNKPAWKRLPGEKVEWRAVTAHDPETGERRLLGFSSLVKAVAYMQPAVKAGIIRGVNKIAKFPAEAAEAWELPLIVNPTFDDAQPPALGPAYPVNPESAVAGEG